MLRSRSPFLNRPATRHSIAVAAVVVAAGSLAAQAVIPSAASGPVTASGAPPRAASVTETLTALEAGRLGQQQAASAAVRREAAAQPAPPALTAGYLVSPAVFAFLTKGLGLNLSSPELTGPTGAGTASGTGDPALSLTTVAPDLSALLPSGVSAPAMSPAVLTVDQRTGTLTVTSAGTTASMSVAITHPGTATLAGGADLTGRVSLPATVLGTAVTLSGPLTDAGGTARLSLSGALPAAVRRDGGRVRLAEGDPVTAATGGGLDLSGTATLGPAAHQVRVAVGGNVGDPRDWTLTVSSVLGGAPLPGLTLAASASGSVTDSAGAVSYDVRGELADRWQPVAAATFDGASAEFADRLRVTGATVAPGMTATTPWVDVTGPLQLADGAVGALTATGTLAANLVTGQALLSGAQQGTAALTPPPAPGQSLLAQPPESITGAGFRGALSIGQAGLSGTVRGTGILTVTTVTGQPVPAASTFTAAPAPSAGITSAGSASAAAHDAATARSALVAALAATGRQAPAAASRPRLALRATATATAKDTFTLSEAVYNFLTGTLHVSPLSQTVGGPLSGGILTVTAGSLGPLTLADGVATPSFGPVTIAIDKTAGTLTLTAAAAAGTVSGAISVRIANPGGATLFGAGAGVSGTLTLAGLPFFGGATASVVGTLGYSGGALTAAVSGTMDTPATFGGDVRVERGATVSLATGGPFTVSGTADIGPSGNSFGVHVQGSLSGLSTWSLTVSDADLPPWKPVPELTVTPDFSGTITDTAGTVRFTLTGGAGPGARLLSWQPDGSGGPQLELSSLRVSNAAPSGAYPCDKVAAAGQVWIGATGTMSYSALPLAGSGQLDAGACVGVGDRHFTITTGATGAPGSGVFGLGPFSVSDLGLTVTYDGTKFLVTGTARLSVTSPAPITVSLGLAFGSHGIIGAATLTAQAALAGAGRAAPVVGKAYLYLSSSTQQLFDPGAFGLQNLGPAFPASVPLQRGVTIAYDSALPQQVTKDFNDIGVSPPSSLQVFAAASLSTSGVSLDVAADFGQSQDGLPVLGSEGTELYFNDVDFGIVVSNDIAATTIRVSGDAYLVIGKLHSHVSISLGGSLTAAGDIAFSLAARSWTNAFGVTGLEVGTLAIQVGFDAVDEEPTFSISADGITFPNPVSNAIGLADGAVVTIDASFEADDPLVNFSIRAPATAPSHQPVLYPLAVAYGGVDKGMMTNRQALNSILVYQAQFYIAPEGGLTAANQELKRGFDVTFTAAVAGHSVSVAAGVTTAPPSLSVNVSASPVSLGQLSLGATSFYLMAGPQDSPPVSLGFTGSLTVGSADGSSAYYSLSANLHLAVGSQTMNNASVDLAVTAGLPSFLQVTGELSGAVAESGGGQVSFEAQGGGNFTVTVPLYLGGGTHALGGVTFSLNQGASSFDWGTTDSVSSIVDFFTSAYANVNTTVAILRHLGLNSYQILNSLGADGVTGQAVLTDLETGFGAFSLTYYDIWVEPSWGDPALPVIAVADASTTPGHRVIDWYWTDGYEQDWKFVEDAGSGYYEIVNRNSGQCLTVPGGDGSALAAAAGTGVVQDPCVYLSTQLWRLGAGSPKLGPHFTIQNWGSGLYLDIQGASPNFGTIVDQWQYNGGSNQYFWLTNSGNK